MTSKHKKQLLDLIDYTIIPAFNEDLYNGQEVSDDELLEAIVFLTVNLVKKIKK